MENNIKHFNIELKFALQNYLKKKYDTSLNSLLKVLELKPKHNLTLLLLGKIHEKRDEQKEAHMFYERCGLLEAKLREALLFEDEGNSLLAAARLNQVIGDYEKNEAKGMELDKLEQIFSNQTENESKVQENTVDKTDTSDTIPEFKSLSLNSEKKLSKIAKPLSQVIAEAYFHFGRFYEDGIGVLKDDLKAIEFYEKSGTASSLYNLGVYFEDIDLKKSISYYERSSALGDADATYNLGIIYETKLNDESKSIEYYEKAALEGSADANYNLGVYYDKLNNHEKAKSYYNEAVNLGSADAMYNLALMYEEGQLDFEFQSKIASDEVEPNSNDSDSDEDSDEDTVEDKRNEKALELYMRAAKNNHADALYNLGYIYDNGTLGEEQNSQKAFIYYQKAAKLDHKDAVFNLACMFRSGQGLEQPDYKSALKFFKKAHELGHERALINIGTLIYSEEELENMQKEAKK